ncbi:MAG: hypothetical protein GC192_00115 [Bacteroidetes bacterium]|nr:hypothetical protein [Bacteroidota bacterium]
MHPVLQEVIRKKEKPSVEAWIEMVDFFIDKYSIGKNKSRNPALAFAWLSMCIVLAKNLTHYERTAILTNILCTTHVKKAISMMQ